MTTLKLTSKADHSVQYDASELFPVGRFRSWKKGDVTNPRWLKRQNGSDFVTIETERDIGDFEKYLAQADERLAVEFYNTFTTGTDRNGTPMLVLSDMDHEGNATKRAIVVVPNTGLALRVVGLVDQFCGESEGV